MRGSTEETTTAVGNFTALGIRLAVYMLVSLAIATSVRELARARTASTLGDPTPRLWGRLTLNPKAWFEPFGSGLVPGLIAVLWTVQVLVIPAAYGKPAPVDPSYLRRTRDLVFVSIAGPIANLTLAIVAGLLVRMAIFPLEGARALVVFAFTNAASLVFHLLPIPGLDGARVVGMLLPPQAREVYRNADKYLPLFVLVALFVFSTLTLGFLTTLAGAICDAATGLPCEQVMQIG
ncbi:MAG: site-2 protease family protein [Actinomycetota bacterium]|nr:site-2 protease family protein [Actinomycetota bacterium]MDH5313079.1 site-2 protease family protein [Actinomycetota bacterium]